MHKLFKIALILVLIIIFLIVFFGFTLFIRLFGNPLYDSRAEVLRYNGKPTAYYRLGEKIYFKSLQQHIAINYKFLDGVDTESFEVLEGGYAKDKNYVYSGGGKRNLDPKSFRVLDCYILDKDNVYFDYNSIPISQDVENFELIGKEQFCMARDSNFVYIRDKKIEGADPKSFEVINYEFNKDAKNVYYRTKALEGVDPDTFESLNSWWSRDKNHIILGAKIVEELKPENVEKVYETTKYSDKEYLDNWSISVGGKIYKKIQESPYYEEIEMQENFVLRDE